MTHGTPYQYASFWSPPESVSDHARLRGERRRSRGSRAARATATCAGEREPVARRARPRARVSREDDGLVEPVRGPRRSGRAAAGRRSPRGAPWRRRSCRARPSREDPRARGRAARTAAPRRPSRRRRPRSAVRRPRAASVSRERSSGAKSRSAASRSTSIRLRSSGIVRSPLRSPASTWATGTPASHAARAPASVEFVSP